MRLRRLRVALVLALLALCAAAPAGAESTGDGVRVGEAPQLPPGATFEGTVAPERELQLYVALEPRDPAALESFAEEVATPGSPVYGDYLSVQKFATRFGAGPKEMATVRSALTERGLDVGEPSDNHLSLPITATAAEAEDAFATPIDRVETSSGRVAFANRRAPQVADAAAPFVQDVLGLDDLELSHQVEDRHTESASARAGTVKPRTDAPIAAGPQPCEKATATAVGKHGYTADQIAAAYGLSSFYAAGDLGAGQTVAVLSLEPLLPADIETFQACYDTHTKVITKTVGKGPGPYEGEDDETALDVEQLIGLAPRSRVLVYQTQNSGTAEARILSAWVSQDTAAVMTSSWGRCEERTSEERASTTDFLLQEAAAQGQTFFVASGDWGSTDCYEPNHGNLNKALRIDFPSGDPFATAVGGTRLEKPTTPAPIEYLWNEAPKWGAGGGGISEFFPMPAYQRTARSSLNVLGPLSSGAPCGHIARYCRQIPDVSADAAPQTGYVVHSEEKWDVTGGTSAGAPFWAALAALINASPACDGDSIGFANPALYEIGGSAYAANFRDVTGPRPRGMPTINIFDASRPFPAGPGYDMATGIGTPLGGALGGSLCALLRPPAPTPPAPSPSAPTSPSAPAPPSPSSAAPPAHSPARVVHAHLAGLATGKPRLTVTVAAREDARIDAATLTLPAGLTAAKAKKDLTAGIIVRDPSGHRLTARPQGAGRIIRVGFPGQTRVTLSVGPPAFVIAPRLRSQLRGGRAHKMRFVVVTRESDGPGARFPLSLGA